MFSSWNLPFPLIEWLETEKFSHLNSRWFDCNTSGMVFIIKYQGCRISWNFSYLCVLPSETGTELHERYQAEPMHTWSSTPICSCSLYNKKTISFNIANCRELIWTKKMINNFVQLGPSQTKILVFRFWPKIHTTVASNTILTLLTSSSQTKHEHK